MAAIRTLLVDLRFEKKWKVDKSNRKGISGVMSRLTLAKSGKIGTKGMEELLSKKNPIFIEWPEKIKRFLPIDTIWVKLYINENHIRTIEIADEYRS